MTIAELRELSTTRDWFRVVLARPCAGRRSMMVAPGLRGEVLCENSDGKAVVLVQSKDALRWLAKHGGDDAR